MFMKVALLNPRVESYSSILPPLGLLYIASVLEKHHTVRVFDPLPGDTFAVDDIARFSPDIVGVSILTTYLERAQELVGLLRKQLPRAYYIAGGIHSTSLPEETLDSLGVDGICIGEGEATMRDLCSALESGKPAESVHGLLWHKKSQTIRTPRRSLIEDLDLLPFPARHLLPFDSYLFPPGIIRGHWSSRSTTILGSRGCPYPCIWCGSRALFGRRVRYRSPFSIAEEARELKERWRVDSLWFIDDTFTLNKTWAMEVSRSLKALKLQWGCQARVNTADEEMFRTMREGGCIQLDFGVESGSDRVLRAIGKGTTSDEARRAFAVARRVGLRTLASFMIGSPEEGPDEVEESIRLAREIRPDFTSVYHLTPFPGTTLFTTARREGWIKGGDYGRMGLKREPMMEIRMSSREQKAFRRRFQNSFSLRNYLGILRSPSYLAKACVLALSHPLGLLKGAVSYMRTGIFDDFAFSFLIHYVQVRQRGLRGR